MKIIFILDTLHWKIKLINIKDFELKNKTYYKLYYNMEIYEHNIRLCKYIIICPIENFFILINKYSQLKNQSLDDMIINNEEYPELMAILNVSAC